METRRPAECTDETERRVLADIEEYGWHCVNIVRREQDDPHPLWAFSVGLFSTFQHPEIVIFGDDTDSMHAIINEIVEQIRDGQAFAPGREYADVLEEYLCTFRTVSRRWYADYLGLALWYYKREDFPVLQCVWPDKDGRYPWDEGCDDTVRGLQPLLFAE